MKQYIIDAFTDKIFSGNPAAVCLPESWPADELMQQIARENCLSETAFAVKQSPGHYHLRWFTPGGEIDLCGHATLATAYVIMNYAEKNAERILFQTKSGELSVVKNSERYEMDFPQYDLKEVPVTPAMTDALGAAPIQAWMGRDLLCILDSEDTVKHLHPDFDKIEQLDGLLLHITAPGSAYDCVSRSFAPKLRVPEDPVCGSGHCHIIPYWSRKTGKTEFTAYQASPRSGVLYCQITGDRIRISGKAAVFSIGEIFV